MKKLTFIISAIILSFSAVCQGKEIPVTVKPFYKAEVTTNQIEHVRNLAQKVVNPDELNKVSITFSNNCHPGKDYYAIIHLPRLTTSSHAVYRHIKVHCSAWPNRYFKTGYDEKKKNAKPAKWHHERSIVLNPLFNIEGTTYEFDFTPEISRIEIDKILRSIHKNEAVLECEVPEKASWPIDAKRVSWISSEEGNFMIWTRSDPESYHPNGSTYQARFKDGKLVVLKIGNWIS